VPPEDPALHALARFASGHAALHEDLDRSTARRELESALRTARQEGFEYLILQCLDALAALAEAEGDIRRMHRAIAEVLGSATERGWQRSAPYVGAATRLAFAELVRAEPTQAARRAAQLLARGDGELEPVQRYALHVVHGAAVADLGESATGLTELRQARTEHGAGPADRKLLAAAASFEFGSAITLGHQASARAAQDWLAQRVGDTAELRLMRSRVASTAGRHADARAEIGPVLDGSSEALLATTPIEAWLQEAQIASRAGERLSARHALTAALQLAEPLDALRPFAQAHPTILRLLAVYHADADISTFAGRALAVERRAASPAYAELSARELTVLSLLPSLLTMDEIADELTVSVNTIKSHVRSIYGKLNVPNRRTAVLAAHAQGLLRRRAD
jgi:LuxR family maltose regulon positive regulatory protein